MRFLELSIVKIAAILITYYIGQGQTLPALGAIESSKMIVPQVVVDTSILESHKTFRQNQVDL